MSDAELKEKVQELIDSSINPAVAGHGGYVELIDVQDTRVYLQMGGGCQGCGAADITLKSGIERLIKEEIPEVTEVLDTTDHASGANPYYLAVSVRSIRHRIVSVERIVGDTAIPMVRQDYNVWVESPVSGAPVDTMHLRVTDSHGGTVEADVLVTPNLVVATDQFPVCPG